MEPEWQPNWWSYQSDLSCYSKRQLYGDGDEWQLLQYFDSDGCNSESDSGNSDHHTRRSDNLLHWRQCNADFQ